MQKLFSLFIFLCLMLIIPSVSFAHETDSTPANDRENTATTDQAQRVTDREQARVQRASDSAERRCAVMQNKLQIRIQRYELNIAQHSRRYAHLMEILNALVARLNEAGIDTSTVEGYLVVLQDKIDVFTTDAEAVVAALEELKAMDCPNPDGQIDDKLGDARSLLQKLREDVRDIHAYLSETIRPAIRELRASASAADARVENSDSDQE